jgi:ABC-2 type transport system ATP-binding protein
VKHPGSAARAIGTPVGDQGFKTVTELSRPQFGPPIIEARGLVKRYGDLSAVNNIDLTVYEGEIFGILGPNGAGKTTAIEMIEGIRPPDQGTIQVAGIDAVTEPRKLRKVIGAQLQSTALFDYLSAAELIKLYCALYDVDDSPARIDELLALVNLEEKRESKVNELSGGQKQRLAITLALVNHPKVVFLDEPTTGLDPAARRSLWSTVQGVRNRGATVVLTTHYMEEAEVLCDRVALFDRGQMIACDTTQALIRSLSMNATINATIEQGWLDETALAALPAVASATVHTTGHQPVLSLTTTNAQQSMIGLLELATRSGVTLGDLRSSQANLEDVFLQLTGRSYAHEPELSTEPAEPKRGRRSRGRNG